MTATCISHRWHRPQGSSTREVQVPFFLPDWVPGTSSGSRVAAWFAFDQPRAGRAPAAALEAGNV